MTGGPGCRVISEKKRLSEGGVLESSRAFSGRRRGGAAAEKARLKVRRASREHFSCHDGCPVKARSGIHRGTIGPLLRLDRVSFARSEAGWKGAFDMTAW